MSEQTPETPPANTLRGRLRARREAAADRLYLDRPVPRMEDIVVRFKPLPSGRLEQITKTTEKSKNVERFVIGAATSLAECCLGIYEVTDDEDAATEKTADGRLLVSVDPDSDDPVRFDSRLAALLEIHDPGKAVPIVRALYLTDGDVTAESNALTEWSGYTGAELLEEYAGN